MEETARKLRHLRRKRGEFSEMRFHWRSLPPDRSSIKSESYRCKTHQGRLPIYSFAEGAASGAAILVVEWNCDAQITAQASEARAPRSAAAAAHQKKKKAARGLRKLPGVLFGAQIRQPWRLHPF
jgi:hypothetical protein